MSSFHFNVNLTKSNRLCSIMLRKTKTGWSTLDNMPSYEDASPSGDPDIYILFRNKNVAYPSDFGVLLEDIWNKLDSEKIDDIRAQKRLNSLAEWVASCDQGKPKWSLLNPPSDYVEE